MFSLFFELVFSVFLSLSWITQAAPIASANTTITPATLFANGQTAQRLNLQFQSLKLTDPCPTTTPDGETLQQACISRSIAQCTNGQWQVTTPCLESQNCFAIPLLTASGTSLICTSQKNADSLLEAVGVTAGNGTPAVTVTVTAAPIPSHFEQTKTISPDEASQLLSNWTNVTPVPVPTMTGYPCNMTPS